MEVSTYWNAIHVAVANGIPERLRTSDTPTNVMAGVTSGALDCWALMGIEKDTNKAHFIGAGTTAIQEDVWLKRRTLVVYSLYSLVPVSAHLMKAALKPVVEYAREQQCVAVVGYSGNAGALGLGKLLGFKEVARVVELEV
jgi:hypothetical protein